MRRADNFPYFHCGGRPPADEREAFDGRGSLAEYRAAVEPVLREMARLNAKPQPTLREMAKHIRKPPVRATATAAKAPARTQLDPQALWAQIRSMQRKVPAC